MVRAGRLVAVVLLTLALVAGCGGGGADEASTTTTSGPLPTEEPPPTPPPTTSPPPTQPPPSPPTVSMSWMAAGALVWHEEDLSPEALAERMLSAGFGWVALRMHDGLEEDPVVDDWIGRFRRASGLPIGGWGVLRESPEREGMLAGELVERLGLDFFIANAEAEYDYGGPDGPSEDRYGRSERYVEAFRSRLPELPAGLSTYCRADRHDLHWEAWRRAGFVLLPQAYVNDFGAEATPAACVRGATGLFPRGEVHPTVGMHPGAMRPVQARGYAPLLDRAGTVGFSIYLAETRMTDLQWSIFGDAIRERGIARIP